MSQMQNVRRLGECVMKQEDALLYILQWVRDGSPSRYSNYGYDIYISNVLDSYLQSEGLDPETSPGYHKKQELSSTFFAAAWELCRRGIIRPGVRTLSEQSTDEGSAGNGYSITPFGRQWLDEDQDVFVPTEPGRFSEMLNPYKTRFGPGFFDRAQEAIRCYGAHAYLACCAMCGAAAESILLAVAVKKVGDEQKVLKTYSSSNGRSRVENMIIGQATGHIQREFRGYTDLLKYWRDEASHGKASSISDNEAYTSLALLLRYATFVNDNWDDLI